MTTATKNCIEIFGGPHDGQELIMLDRPPTVILQTCIQRFAHYRKSDSNPNRYLFVGVVGSDEHPMGVLP